MHGRDRDEPLGVDLFEALEDIRPPHAGIDQNDHRPGLKERERQSDKLERGPDHQHHPATASDPQLQQPASEPVALLIELAKRPLRIRHPPLAISPHRTHHRPLPRPLPGRVAKSISNVEGLVDGGVLSVERKPTGCNRWAFLTEN